MDTVFLDSARNVDQVFVDHGHKSGVVLGGQVAENLLEGVDVIGSVVGRQGDASQQNLDVRVFERGYNRIQILARLVGGQATEAVVTTEFDDHDFRAHAQYRGKTRNGVLGGGATGALVDDLVVETVTIQLFLQKVSICLTVFQSIAGGDAVAEADDDALFGGERRNDEKKCKERNDKSAANVHILSVAKSKD